MKSFAKLEFFRVFDRLVRPRGDAGAERRWSIEGVTWREMRQSSSSPEYTLTLDIITGERPGKRGWSVMVVRETWWVGNAVDPFRSSQWAHLLSGKRADAFAWFDHLAAEAAPQNAGVAATAQPGEDA